jgi:hypothetical protein
MIIQLRRRHYYTWLALAVLLPIGFVWAYLNIPQMPSDVFNKTATKAFPNLIQSKETTSLKVILRQNTVTPSRDEAIGIKGGYQIELTVLQPLVGAANQLYLSTTSEKPLQILLGALGNTGTYYFALPNTVTSMSPLTLTVYDAIKQKQTEQIILKP